MTGQIVLFNPFLPGDRCVVASLQHVSWGGGHVWLRRGYGRTGIHGGAALGTRVGRAEGFAWGWSPWSHSRLRVNGLGKPICKGGDFAPQLCRAGGFSPTHSARGCCQVAQHRAALGKCAASPSICKCFAFLSSIEIQKGNCFPLAELIVISLLDNCPLV